MNDVKWKQTVLTPYTHLIFFKTKGMWLFIGYSCVFPWPAAFREITAHHRTHTSSTATRNCYLCKPKHSSRMTHFSFIAHIWYHSHSNPKSICLQLKYFCHTGWNSDTLMMTPNTHKTKGRIKIISSTDEFIHEPDVAPIYPLSRHVCCYQLGSSPHFMLFCK